MAAKVALLKKYKVKTTDSIFENVFFKQWNLQLSDSF